MTLGLFLGIFSATANVLPEKGEHAEIKSTVQASPQTHAQDNRLPEILPKNKPTRPETTYIPIAFYSPETSVAAGAMAVHSFRDSEQQIQSSSLTLLAFVTFNKQALASMTSSIFTEEPRWNFITSLAVSRFPEKFYGIGNDTPTSAEENVTPQSARIHLSGLKNIAYAWSFGPSLEWRNTRIVKWDEGGAVANEDVRGARQFVLFGVGPHLRWDSRDNSFSAYRGAFLDIEYTMYRKILGRGSRYFRLFADARKYIPLLPGNILALQAVSQNLVGQPPFLMLPKTGGSELMRGLFEGRYRDKDLIAFQIEDRIQLSDRLWLAAFSATGNVFSSFREINIQKFDVTGGAGVRWILNTEDRVNVRLDVGFSQESLVPGFYFSVGEAY